MTFQTIFVDREADSAIQAFDCRQLCKSGNVQSAGSCGRAGPFFFNLLKGSPDDRRGGESILGES